MTISLGEYFEEFISRSIKTGRYESANEVLKAGLRLLEDEENKRMTLKYALKEGEDSVPDEDFDPVAFLSEIEEKLMSDDI